MVEISRTCIHTHTCNPPGPNATTHSHTCCHTHTKVLIIPPGTTLEKQNSTTYNRNSKKTTKRRPLGNRVAVRKYRKKKKAHTASLEEQVKKLRVLNQELVTELQRQAVLESEVVRLRGLLVDFRVKIDHLELESCPFGNARSD